MVLGNGRILWNRLSRWRFIRRIPLRLAVNYLRPQQGRRFPDKIQIEATSRCNLRCPSCSYAKEGVAGRHLGAGELRHALAALPFRPRRVILSGIGEPLVNPEFFALVDILAEHGIHCVFFTNGTLLSAKMRGAILARENIDEICISCDGARKSTFEALRLGADFDKWSASVRQFLVEARQSPHPPRVVANIVASKGNLNELGDILRLVKDLGFDSANLLEPVPVDNVAESLYLAENDIQSLRSGNLLKQAKDLHLRVDWYLRRKGSPPQAMVRCIQPWEYIFIHSNGDIAPCSAVFGPGKTAVMGNILAQPFHDIWRGERFREFRLQSASGTNALCRICPYY
jgi:radical SAM protein with 4Fe4S-binding SPASM domain